MEQAKEIIKLRPFGSIDDLNIKLGQGRKKAGPAGISPRLFEDCTTIFEGYGRVDSILHECELIGASLRSRIEAWSTPNKKKGKRPAASTSRSSSVATVDALPDGAVDLVSIDGLKAKADNNQLLTQPAIMSDTLQLKEYQLLGLNWLNLLYKEEYSCILADEMGRISKIIKFCTVTDEFTYQVWVKLSKSSRSLHP